MASAKIQRMSKSVKQRPTRDRQASQNDVPEEIQCKICKKRYEDPKLLPCLHTFCKGCLERNLDKHGGVLYCPICPGEVRSTDVDKLLSNFMVSSLLQAIDLKRGTSSKQCESCEEGVIASSRCYECSDFLCDNCVQAHRRVRFTKQHRVVSVNNLAADSLVRTPSCSTHAGEAVKMFCRQCKQPVCRLCILDEHNEHILVSLKEAASDAKPKLNTLLVATRAKIPILQRKLKNVQSSKEKLEVKIDEVIKDIQATSARILMAVKRREKDLYRMLRRIHDKKSDLLEGREAALENELAQVLDACDFADELAKQEHDAMVLHVSETTYARLKVLGGREIENVPEIHEDEIQYTVDEKPVLDRLKIYGKIVSREDKAKTAEGKARDRCGGEQNKNSKEVSGNGAQENETKQQTIKNVSNKEGEHERKPVERRASWLQTLANPRALLRRLSLGGDDMEDKKPDQQTGPKDHSPTAEEITQSERSASKVETAERQRKKHESEKSQSERSGSILKCEGNKHENSGQERTEQLYASPTTTRSDPSRDPQSANANTTSIQEKGQAVSEPASVTQSVKTDPIPSPENEAKNSTSEQPTGDKDGTYETPKTQSILKSPSPRKEPLTDSLSPDTSQAWTIQPGSRPSGSNSLSYLPSLNILTKNRRGRPREVEIQLESPDNSIVSAQIMDHKNGTFTIFYCPLTPGEHNLYVNVGGKNIKHGKKVLNFCGKFGGMGAEELFLTRRALSCIRWQVTPGFIEIKDKKKIANLNI